MQGRGIIAAMIVAAALSCAVGCRGKRTGSWALHSKAAALPATQIRQTPLVQQVSHAETFGDVEVTSGMRPPTVDEFDQLTLWNLTLDNAVALALSSSQVVRDHGGRVLAYPDTIRTTLDAAVVASDPNLGPEAALSAFDTQFETALVWNGGGSSVNSAFSTGQFGVFSQPETLAKVGFGKLLHSGTKVAVGGVGGYDDQLAGGLYAAYGAEVRHPLMRGGGKDVNAIAGPQAKAGVYRGVLISQIGHHKAQLEVERSVRDLVRDVSVAYWELSFAFQNLKAKQTAMANAKSVWQREQQRVAANAAPEDVEALARQQYYSTVSAVRNAIAGTGHGRLGVYAVEMRLRTLLGVPDGDRKLICPTGAPLEATMRFDWHESRVRATSSRIELRIQQANIDRRVLERKAAKNLRLPQVDLVGQYRRLADDPGSDTELFSEALQGWQVGIDYRRSIRNRRENAAYRNADLQLSREQAIADEQRRHVSSELRTAFIEMDRAMGAMHFMALSRDAALIRLKAQSERHAAGDVHVERVLEAQIRATKAETEFQRSVIDYNVAFIKLHYSRGSLLETMGVGFGEPTEDECRFALNTPSAFAQPRAIDRNRGDTQVANQPARQTLAR